MRFMDNLDLFKAKRDTSKLVQVQRTVSRGGKSFIQKFWVKPSDVRSTDKVIGGQQNLLPTPGSVPQPAAGVLDKVYFDSIKSDKKKALEYLKSCGVTWKEHDHASINWMRAMQAMTTSLGGTSPQGGKKMVAQVNVQPQPQTQQSPQNSQPGSQSPSVTLTQSQQDELNTGKNGKEKTVILKKLLGNDGCAAYAKQLGVTWDEHPHASINNMRMSMALKEHFDRVDGTVSPGKSASGDVGAPQGNKNAKKDTKKKEVKDDTLLKIPDNATESQKNIISLLNTISDEKDLQTYISVGMIPEDDVSKSFIEEKLAPKYSLWKAAHLKPKSSTKDRNNHNNSSGFADQIAYDLKIEGCAKSVVGQGLRKLYDEFHMGLLVDPRAFISAPFASTGSPVNSQSISGTIAALNTFSTYATEEFTDDDGKSLFPTSLGYTGWDTEKYSQRYDKDKEGFIRVLKHIAKENPDLSLKCGQMADTYDEMMKIAKYNPNLLKAIIKSDTWDTSMPADDKISWYKLSQYGSSINSPGESAVFLSTMKNQIRNIPKALKALGYSDEDIMYTLEYSWYNTSLSGFEAKKKSTGETDIVDLTTVMDENGQPYFSKDDGSDRTVSSVLDMCLEEFSGVPHQDKTWEVYNKLQAVAQTSQDDYKKIHELTTKLFGVKYVDNNGDVDLSNVDVSDNYFGRDIQLAKAGDDTQLDRIISNLLMSKISQESNRDILVAVSDNPRTKINQRGSAYHKNFDYYDPTKFHGVPGRQKSFSYGWNTETFSGAKEINDTVDRQIRKLPMFSEQYIDNLTSYYTAVANYGNAGDVAKKATFKSVGIHFEDYVNSPLKDVLYTMTGDMVSHIPTMVQKKGKGSQAGLNKYLAEKMDYVPYDFTTSTQKTLSELQAKPKKATQTQSDNQLKKLRQEALKAVHCTIEVEDEATSLQMRKDFMNNWDYDGVSHPKLYSGAKSFMGADRRALFNSRFFKVKNSSFEKPFEEMVQKTGQVPEEHYHATSYASTAGILGAKGGWMIGSKYMKTAQALGPGAYFGRKGGKSSVYCGEGQGGYHNLYSTGSEGDKANGCYILAQLVHGETNDTTVSNSFREYEIVVRNNACILPHHFVDISCRALGVNVTRDAKGNYLDKDGNITHDRYGQKIDMK